MEPFKAHVTIEGSKRKGMRVTIPRTTVEKVGLREGGWVRFRAKGSEPFFAYARRPPSRASVEVGLPLRFFDMSLALKTIDCAVENAEPYRARSWTERVGFDWLPFVQEWYFPTETLDGKLLLHNRHEEPFEMRRVTPLLETYRLLGWYQAKGSKSAQAPDFVFANGNVAALKHYADLLGAWGLGHERLSLEVLREKNQSIENARGLYVGLGVEIVAERIRPGKGEHAGVLHVKKSQPLLRLVKGALVQVFECKWPSAEAAREYTLGWLDGDGTITINGTASVDLRLAGLADEHRVLQHALGAGFTWGYDKGTGWQNNKQGTHITLRAREILHLLDANAFSFTLSRVRLLLAFDDRTRGLRNGERHGAYARWGLVDTDGMLTEIGDEVCKGYDRWAQKIERARQLKATSPHLFGRKGVPLPDEFKIEKS